MSFLMPGALRGILPLEKHGEGRSIQVSVGVRVEKLDGAGGQTVRREPAGSVEDVSHDGLLDRIACVLEAAVIRKAMVNRDVPRAKLERNAVRSDNRAKVRGKPLGNALLKAVAE